MLALLALAVSLVVAAPATSEPMRTVAILDLSAKQGVAAAEALSLTELLYAATFGTAKGEYTVIARNRREDLLREIEFASSGLCDDISCALEVGKFLSASYAIFGSIAKLGTSYHLTLQMVDVATSAIEGSSRVESLSIDGIVRGLEGAVAALFGMENVRRREIVAIDPTTAAPLPALSRPRVDVHAWDPAGTTGFLRLSPEEYVARLSDVQAAEIVPGVEADWLVIRYRETDSFDGTITDVARAVTVTSLERVHRDLYNIHFILSRRRSGGQTDWELAVQVFSREYFFIEILAAAQVKIENRIVALKGHGDMRFSSAGLPSSRLTCPLDVTSRDLVLGIKTDTAIRVPTSYSPLRGSRGVFPITMTIPREVFAAARFGD